MGMLDWADDSNEAVQTWKEVGTLMLSNAAASTVLGAVAQYSHSKDPVAGGMPAIGGVLGADAILSLVTLPLAIFGGDTVGSMGQTILLGFCGAGVGSTFNGLGSRLGKAIFDATKAKTPGTGALGEGDDTGGLSEEAAQALAEFRKAA